MPDPSLTIREGAVAAWPGAWQGQNLRDILITLGYDIDKPWRKLPKRQRNWILFTDEQPTVEIHPDRARRHRRLLLQRHLLERRAPRPAHAGQLAERDDARRVLQFVDSVACPVCDGSGLRPEALAVTFAGRNIAELVALPLAELADSAAPGGHPDRSEAALRGHGVRRADRGGHDDRRRPGRPHRRC